MGPWQWLQSASPHRQKHWPGGGQQPRFIHPCPIALCFVVALMLGQEICYSTLVSTHCKIKGGRNFKPRTQLSKQVCRAS